MTLIAWDPNFLVGVEPFDRQHRELFALLNQLNESMRHGAEPTERILLLSRLLESAELHFNDEERALARTDYPDLDRHHLQHNQLLTEAVTFQRMIDRSEGAIPLPLMVFLRDWLSEHILETDKGCGEYLSRGVA